MHFDELPIPVSNGLSPYEGEGSDEEQVDSVSVSRLQEKALLNLTTKVPHFQELTGFCVIFKEENKFAFCHNISGFLQKLGIPSYSPNDWQLYF